MHRILVVDDTPSIHDDFAKIFAEGGAGQSALEAAVFGQSSAAVLGNKFDLQSAFQGEQALQLLKAALAAGRPFSVAFVDMRMPPGWDGIETIRQLWAQDPELQVVICTAYSDQSWTSITRQLGVHDNLIVLKKPFDNIEVQQLAHALTRKWELSREVHRHVTQLNELVTERTAALQATNEKLTREVAERTAAETALRLSEERFAKAFRSSPVGLAIQSVDTRKFIDLNVVFETITGFSREELLGRTPDELRLMADDSCGVELAKRMAGTAASLRDFRCRVRTKDGKLRETLISLEYLELPTERCLLILAQDITDKLKDAEALAASREMIREITSAIPIAVYRYRRDNDGKPRMYFISDRVRELCGVEAAEVMRDATLLFERIVPEDRRRFIEQDGAFSTAGGDFSMEFRMLSPNGGIRWLFAAAFPIKLSDGQTVAQGYIQEITERKAAEQNLRASEERLQQAVRVANIGISVHDLEKDSFYWSVEQREIFGVGPDEKISFTDFINKVVAEDRERVKERIRAAHLPANDGATSHAYDNAYRICRPDGSIRHLSVRGRVFFDEKGGGVRRAVRVVNATRDVTEEVATQMERQRLQSQLLQAQRMESIGRLAGGVAHDFNNMLQVILGNVDLAKSEAGGNSVLKECLEEIHRSAERSGALTGQLLAFARKQVVNPRLVDLNEVVANVLKMLRRLIGEDIHLEWAPGFGLGLVRIDPVQIDQILANLCVNARDAIKGIGAIRLETRNRALSAADLISRPEQRPGNYVVLTVHDTGQGMTAEVLAHIFEPFFTTKEVGKGTGLGLATVFGIVAQNGGFIEVESEVDKGTTFRIHFPMVEGEKTATAKAIFEGAVGGTETILVVEDEPQILKLSVRLLGMLGYTVHAVSTPAEAIGLARRPGLRPEVLLTDVIMPGMNGRELYGAIRQIHPDIRCVFMSGYTDDVITNRGMLEVGMPFLQKPFTATTLADSIRSALA